MKKALLLRTSQLQFPPTHGNPDLVPASHQLSGDEYGDDVEHVRGPSSWQGQRRDPEQDDEEHCEALLLEQVKQRADRMVAALVEPPLDLIADSSDDGSAPC